MDGLDLHDAFLNQRHEPALVVASAAPDSPLARLAAAYDAVCYAACYARDIDARDFDVDAESGVIGGELAKTALRCLGFQLRPDQNTVLREVHVGAALGLHCDNDNGGNQTTLLVYPGGAWEGGGLRAWPQAGEEVLVATTRADGRAVVVAMAGDVEHEPQPATKGRRVCVAFHVDSRAFH